MQLEMQWCTVHSGGKNKTNSRLMRQKPMRITVVTEISYNDNNIRGEDTSLMQALWGNRGDIEGTGA